jgi:ATP-binding cassette subfamily B protein/subfamily B ATP-binding cassette protein MsbA
MAKQTPRARTDWDVVKRLLRYLSGEGLWLAGVVLMLLLSTLGQATGPALIGRAVDQYIARGLRDGLAQTMLLLLAVYLIGWVGFMGQIYLMSVLSQRLLKRLRNDIFEHTQTLSLNYFYKNGAGDLMSRLVNDTDAIGTLFSDSLVQSLGSVFGLVAVLVAMFTLDVPLTLVTIGVLPLMIVATVIFSRRSRVAFRETRRALGMLSAELEQDLSTVREAQSFGVTDAIIAAFANDNAVNRDANITATSITAAFAPTMDVLSTLATVLVAGYGGWLAINGDVTVGVVVAFLSYAQQFFRPVQQLSSLYTQMQSAFAAGERVFDLLDTPPEITDKPNAQTLPEIEGHVRLDNVVFGYDDSRVILNGVSLEAQPGETVALVGETGAGKSTVVNLIGRFYDVQSGSVQIDGYDVRDVSVYSLRSQMGDVPQSSFLFGDTIANNIRYGRRDASDDEVIAAATAARAHEFIMALPQGYDTLLSSEGSSLSQGQRQLLCIARAILANPRLLILDEATANIDTRTERLVQAAIDTLLEGRTAFVIAHRLSTIRNADKIVVIGNGGIVEQGSHAELLAHDGYYAKLIGGY